MQSYKRKHTILKITIILLILIVLAFLIILATKFLLVNESDYLNEGNYQKNNNTFFDVLKSENIIDVPTICQYPDLPTGCEAVAATMVLRYYDEEITANEFASNWLKCNNEFYSLDSKQYGPDPNKFFIGDPFSKSSYGCYSAPIVSAINRNAERCRAEKLENISLEKICKDYIDNNKPILIWATMGMKPSGAGNSWYLEDNSKVTWIAGEHCLVLVGYNENYYFLNDPQSGSVVAYQKDIVNERFKELGSQAIYISDVFNATLGNY